SLRRARAAVAGHARTWVRSTRSGRYRGTRVRAANQPGRAHAHLSVSRAPRPSGGGAPGTRTGPEASASGPVSSGLVSGGDGLLQGRAGRDLHAVAGGDLDLFARAGVTAGAGLALDALHAQQAGDLDGLAIGERGGEDLLQGGDGGVRLGLGQARLLGD